MTREQMLQQAGPAPYLQGPLQPEQVVVTPPRQICPSCWSPPRSRSCRWW
jgi:hypothetical protein